MGIHVRISSGNNGKISISLYTVGIRHGKRVLHVSVHDRKPDQHAYHGKCDLDDLLCNICHSNV